jgi:hypothetical protein
MGVVRDDADPTYDATERVSSTTGRTHAVLDDLRVCLFTSAAAALT